MRFGKNKIAEANRQVTSILLMLTQRCDPPHQFLPSHMTLKLHLAYPLLFINLKQ